MVLRNDLDMVANKSICLCWESYPGHPAHSLVTTDLLQWLITNLFSF
jgi:hypothetical protein